MDTKIIWSNCQQVSIYALFLFPPSPFCGLAFGVADDDEKNGENIKSREPIHEHVGKRMRVRIHENHICGDGKYIHKEDSPALPRAWIPAVAETLCAEPNFVWFRAFSL